VSRIDVVIAPTDPSKCRGQLVQHARLPGVACDRCGYYFDHRYLAALGLRMPLTCGLARDPLVVN
jgi:hypothetical protein